ncbi:MAG: GH92 family glycosyl hydrolase [Bacteroides sp.]|nr:GH92 family glycosyl hydrolase [Bacteroides sp.]
MKHIISLVAVSASIIAMAASCSRQDKAPVDYVNPYMGNISHLLVPTYPTVHLPNSMMRTVPLRSDFTDDTLDGLPVFLTSHRGAQAFSICPWNCPDTLDGSFSYHYDLEKICPYRYDVYLEEVKADVHYAPSHQSAVYRIVFGSDGPHYIVVNSFRGELSFDGKSVSGYEELENGARAYLHLEPHQLPSSVVRISDSRTALVFDRAEVDLKYGVSFISEAQAAANMRRELDGRTLEQVADEGRSIWNKTLSKIKVKGGSDDEKSVFYTSLYRIYERPVNISEDGSYYSGFDGQVHCDNGRPFYVDDWYWDTYLAAHPLRTIIDPGKEMDMVNSAIMAASQTENRWYPMFPLVTGDSHSMNCNHGMATVADCIAKGLVDFDVDMAFKMAENTLQTKSLAPWTYCPAGRLDRFYLEHGYYPGIRDDEPETESEIHGFEKRQPVAVTLGTAFDQWCLSKIAEYAGDSRAAEQYAKRALDYRNIFNQETGFFHPKDEEGNFIEPFDYTWSGGTGFRNAYDENNGHIYRWGVQHNVADLIELMGGEEKFVGELDRMFEATLKKTDVWKQAPDHSALVGNYSMGNEPCMHIPYLYCYAGQPWKTQKWTRKLLDMWFRNDLMGVPGDEDGGGLGSFAVFSMMGFYPVTPGLPVYVLTSPVFEEVEVKVGKGKTFKVKCLDYSEENKYVQGARLNGQVWDRSWISHEDVIDGGLLELEMGRHPNEGRASSPDSYPPSFQIDTKKATPISVPNPQYADFNYGQSDNSNTEWIQNISVIEPECRSDVKGKVTVRFSAPGMTEAKAMLWRQPSGSDRSVWGHDECLTPRKGLKIGKDGTASFSFNADRFPAGPMNVRIYAHNDKGEKDFFELQLYNTGGVGWSQGIPESAPAGAKGLKLIFEDDFDGPLSISNDGRNARYNAHKPRFGDFSGWQFADVDGPDNPFFQRDTYLKIAARKRPGTNGSSGLIASVNMDGEGLWVKAPCYLECRFTAQSAPGTWPAFWTITGIDRDTAGDELDIIEAYGGVGPGNPNHPGYSICSHFWGQKNPDGTDRGHRDCVVPMMEIGGGSYWSTTFHTYAVRIDLDDTVYYCDDIEVFRHPTNDVSRDRPHLFLVNYAIGGISGWGIDLERYGNGTDMYVDYIRVYAEEEIEYSIPRH